MAFLSRTGFRWRENAPFVGLVSFLIIVFLFGGGSRSDVQSLVVLRPLTAVFCGFACWSIRREHIRAYRFFFGMAAAIFALVLMQMVPLPAPVWGLLPGREILSDIDRVTGLGAVWRPISIVPSGTWNAFYALFAPLTALIFGVQLTREQRFLLLPVLLVFGALSGLLGLLQAIGDPDGPLYFYQITNNGSAVGLFANRNHQAVLLAMLFPVLAVYASVGARTEEQAKARGWTAIGAGFVLVPLLLVTGSRAGLLVGVLGLACAAKLYSKPVITVPRKRKVQKFDVRYPLIAFGVLCLGALTVMMSRAEAWQRLAARDPVEDLRFQVWGPIMDMAGKYFPFGSGFGSFAEVYQIDEPYELLSPSYLNHAHNDWLELYFTSGVFGMVLLTIAAYAFIRTALVTFGRRQEPSRDLAFKRLGLIMITILAVGSAGDYPLRTPSLACVFIVAALWAASAVGERTKTAGSS